MSVSQKTVTQILLFVFLFVVVLEFMIAYRVNTSSYTLEQLLELIRIQGFLGLVDKGLLVTILFVIADGAFKD